MATLLPPPPVPSSLRSLRFYQTGTATANFSDNQWYFVLASDATKQAYSKGIRVTNTSATALFISFDGTNTHGQVLGNTSSEYLDRYEGGIYIKGGGTFFVEAW